MLQLVVLALIIGIVAFIVRGNRIAREKWHKRVNLPGTWLLESGEDRLELRGAVSHGLYRRARNGDIETGNWELRGSQLLLQTQEGTTQSFEFVFFDVGKIGLQKPGTTPAVYLKETSNVVSLGSL